MLSNYFKIYFILAYIDCFAYSYRIESITGFVFFLSASLVLIITQYYEGEQFSNVQKIVVLSLYFLCLIFGPVFLYYAINLGPINPKSSTGYIAIMFISFSILIFTIINLIKYNSHGIDEFIEANTESLKSEQAIEREEKKGNLMILLMNIKRIEYLKTEQSFPSVFSVTSVVNSPSLHYLHVLLGKNNPSIHCPKNPNFTYF